MSEPFGAAARVVRNTHHGNQIITPAVTDADDDALQAQTVRLADALPEPPSSRATDAAAGVRAVEFDTPFDYLFDGLAAEYPAHHLDDGDPATVVAQLKELGRAMVEEAAPPGGELQAQGNSTIPPVYTYWGQFIDHDITLNTDNNNGIADITRPDLEPLPPDKVALELRNGRLPALNLDSVYGDGPTFPGDAPTAAANMYDGLALRLSNVAPPPIDEEIPPLGVRDRDLFRIAPSTEAVVGDSRNDENLIVAQLHVAMVRFHNAVLDAVRDAPGAPLDDRELFARVRQLVTWHYQWLVVHDYLKTVTQTGVVDKVLLGGNKVFAKRYGAVYMPLEFSVAAYRFGHTMVRAFYDYNRNFGRKDGGPGVRANFATFEQLFQFTGSARDANGDPAPFAGTGLSTLPRNWVIEWDRFVDKGAVRPDHFARRIDTQLAPPLTEMLNQTGPGLSPDIKELLRALAMRNLLRGYLLSIPTGQAVAGALKIPALTVDELHSGNSAAFNQTLDAGGFQTKTPLWYYILKEAEVKANGNSLGPVGSRIVTETLIGQIREDPYSYLNAPDGPWSPEQGVKNDGEPIVSINDLFRFAGVV
jgi:hypothetical protein